MSPAHLPMILIPVPCHSYPCQIHLTSVRVPPLHISRESISCMSSTHVLPTYWRPARTVIFSPARDYGGSVHVDVLRLLCRLYPARVRHLTSSPTLASSET